MAKGGALTKAADSGISGRASRGVSAPGARSACGGALTCRMTADESGVLRPEGSTPKAPILGVIIRPSLSEAKLSLLQERVKAPAGGGAGMASKAPALLDRRTVLITALLPLLTGAPRTDSSRPGEANNGCDTPNGTPVGDADGGGAASQPLELCRGML